ncbi:hypothetical protein GCM10022419_102050 [Nonomuraea rosea]|uniref:MFS transporter n=1 Tax=Nonomuraea rosea TaxID=638574 RepID=A0ABP6Z8Q4_9ACTN
MAFRGTDSKERRYVAGIPNGVVYRSGAAGAVGSVLGQDAGMAELGVFFAGFMVSSLAWCFVSAGFVRVL